MKIKFIANYEEQLKKQMQPYVVPYKMNISKFEAGTIDSPRTGIFVNMGKKEALSLISSLSQQMLNQNPNTDRLELLCEGHYFTIAVHEDQIVDPLLGISDAKLLKERDAEVSDDE